MDDSIFAEIKKRLNLAEIIGEDVPVRGKGHEYRGARDDCNSLVITRSRTTGEWYYYWNSKNEGGDVFNWLKNQRGMDMKTALEYAAKRAGVSLPEWTKKETKAWVAAKAAEDLMTVAARVFEKWLWASTAALDYCRGRGWTDETIRGARLGFSGFGTEDEIKEMNAELMMNNIDPDSPAAVSIRGVRGDVAAWAQKWDMKHAVSNDDINNGFIPGFMGRPRLIFPHLYFRQVTYLSSRNLERDGERLVSYAGKNKSFNPRREFLGERKPYFGHNYKANASHVVIVEGQPDVLTLAQWGANVFGLCGTSLDGYWGKELAERHVSRYFATDNDTAGQNAVRGKDGDWPIVELVGPLTQVVRWPTAAREIEGARGLKDANDLLQSYTRRGVAHKVQVKAVWTRLNASEPVAILAARDAAQVQKSKIRSQEEKNGALIRAFEIISKLERKTTDLMLKQFVAALGMSVQEFNRNLKVARGERESTDDDISHTIKTTLGGWFPVEEGSEKGWLIDYLFDRVKGKAMLAYRDPNGQIGKAPYLDINGFRYYPRNNDANIASGGVMFANDLGPQKSTRELLGQYELYMRRSFLLDDPLGYKLAAYYGLFTWLYDAFDELAYMRAQGESDSGKSAIILRLGYVCYRLTKSTGAGSAAGFKYLSHIYRGSIFFDEVKDNLDEFDDRVIMLNVGAMKDQANVPMATIVKLPDGTQDYEVVNFNVYGPKLVTMYGKFPQEATESRFLTLKTIKHEPMELKEKNIPRRWSDEMRMQALALCNMAMTWRLHNWRPRLQPPDELEDMRVSTRVNQVTVPIKYILTMDTTDRESKSSLEEVSLVVKSLYEEQLFERSQKVEARIVEAIDAVLNDPAFTILDFVQVTELAEWGSAKYIRYSELTKVVNFIMDEMNLGTGKEPKIALLSDEAEEEEESFPRKGKKKYKAAGVTASTIGRKCRELRLPVHRMGRGFVVIIESSAQAEIVQDRIKLLKVRYGLEDLQYTTPEQKVEEVPAEEEDGDQELVQEDLL